MFKHVSFLVKTLCIPLMGLIAFRGTGQELKPVISSFTVKVNNDIINAFAPSPDSAAADPEIGKYYKDKTPGVRNGYKTYEAFEVDYCYNYLSEHLKSDFGIVLGEKLPKDEEVSYSPYNFPQAGFRKAAKSGKGTSYIRIEVKFSYTESVLSAGNSPTNMLTPTVEITVELADGEGKDVADGKGKATSSKTFKGTTTKIQLWSPATSGTVFRANAAERKTLLKSLFVEAYQNFKSDYKKKE